MKRIFHKCRIYYIDMSIPPQDLTCYFESSYVINDDTGELEDGPISVGDASWNDNIIEALCGAYRLDAEAKITMTEHEITNIEFDTHEPKKQHRKYPY